MIYRKNSNYRLSSDVGTLQRESRRGRGGGTIAMDLIYVAGNIIYTEIEFKHFDKETQMQVIDDGSLYKIAYIIYVHNFMHLTLFINLV